MASLRMTTPRVLVLQALLDKPGDERYGLELALEAGIEPGTVYPILVTFETAGWLTSRAEEIDVHAEGRPRRRYYKLTADGCAAGRDALARAARRRATPSGGRKLAW